MYKRQVLGFVNDKKIDEVLRILPENATYYFVKPSINPVSYTHLDVYKRQITDDSLDHVDDDSLQYNFPQLSMNILSLIHI